MLRLLMNYKQGQISKQKKWIFLKAQLPRFLLHNINLNHNKAASNAAKTPRYNHQTGYTNYFVDNQQVLHLSLIRNLIVIILLI